MELDPENPVVKLCAEGMQAEFAGNLGKSHEDLGAPNEAARWYARAEQVLEVLGEDRYGDIVRDAVRRARARVGDIAR